MKVFSRVARLGSFSGAARELRRSTTAVSRQVSQLEAHLGARLLQRTTRQLHLTPAGQTYLERCERILGAVDELEAEVGEGEARVRGCVRVTVGVDLGREVLAPRLAGFLDRYPEVEVELSLSDRFVDLVAEGFDLAVRTGSLADSTLVARPLATTTLVTVASPAYLEAHGHPEDPAELETHQAIFDTNLSDAHWTFKTAKGQVRVRPPSRLAVNSPAATRAFALEGRGIARLPRFIAERELRGGALVALFAALPVQHLPIRAVTPARHLQSIRTRRYIDYCEETFANFGA